MNTLEIVLAVIAALGLGSIIPDVTRAVIGHFAGRRGREMAELQRLADEVTAAEASAAADRAGREAAEATARALREHAHELRVRLISEHGVSAADLPPFPPTVRA